MPEPRFLVVRLGSLGDIVHTFPAVAGLRQSFPRAEIIWLAHPRWVNLVASSGLASEIWPVDSRDLANVCQTIAKIGVPVLYTNRVHAHATHIADQNGELSLQAGAQSAIGAVKLKVNESDCQRVKSDLAVAGITNYVVLSPGGGWRSKC